MIKAEIIKLLPDDWSYQDRFHFFLKLSDEYKKKSRKEIERENNEFRIKMKA